MLVNSPQVSIIMGTYNRAHLIGETLDSILDQTLENWECLIIDDESSDNTIEILRPYLLKDSRIKLHKRSKNHKKGLSGCRNQGLELAKGDYIIFFDDDDIVHPQNLEVCVYEFSNRDVYYCCYGRNTFVGDFHYNFDYSKEYGYYYMDISYVEKILKYEFLLNSCSVMWRKECFVNDVFNEHLMYAEDWELYSRILSSGIKGISIEKCLFFGRKHPKSNTGEFYRNNPIRRLSKAEAILLAVENLKEKQLLSKSLKRYFVTESLKYAEYNLFARILSKFELLTLEKMKWQIFYKTLPLRLFIFKIIKNHK